MRRSMPRKTRGCRRMTLRSWPSFAGWNGCRCRDGCEPSRVYFDSKAPGRMTICRVDGPEFPAVSPMAKGALRRCREHLHDGRPLLGFRLVVRIFDHCPGRRSPGSVGKSHSAPSRIRISPGRPSRLDPVSPCSEGQKSVSDLPRRLQGKYGQCPHYRTAPANTPDGRISGQHRQTCESASFGPHPWPGR